MGGSGWVEIIRIKALLSSTGLELELSLAIYFYFEYDKLGLSSAKLGAGLVLLALIRSLLTLIDYHWLD